MRDSIHTTEKTEERRSTDWSNQTNTWVHHSLSGVNFMVPGELLANQISADSWQFAYVVGHTDVGWVPVNSIQVDIVNLSELNSKKRLEEIISNIESEGGTVWKSSRPPALMRFIYPKGITEPGWGHWGKPKLNQKSVITSVIGYYIEPKPELLIRVELEKFHDKISVSNWPTAEIFSNKEKDLLDQVVATVSP